jgi:hypothetical protein
VPPLRHGDRAWGRRVALDLVLPSLPACTLSVWNDVADLSPAHSLRQEYESLPGKVTLRWSSVRDATAYTVEVNQRGRGGPISPWSTFPRDD